MASVQEIANREKEAAAEPEKPLAEQPAAAAIIERVAEPVSAIPDDGLSFLAAMQERQEEERNAAELARLPTGSTPLSMTGFELVDYRNGRKGNWRMWGFSGMARQVCQFVFALRAMRDQAFGLQYILNAGMIISRLHEQYVTRNSIDIGESGFEVCYIAQFCNLGKPATPGSMIDGKIEGPKMVIVYLIDAKEVRMIPIGAIVPEDIPSYIATSTPDMVAQKHKKLTEWILEQSGPRGRLRRRCTAKDTFSARTRPARQTATPAAAAKPEKETSEESEETELEAQARGFREAMASASSRLLFRLVMLPNAVSNHV